MKINLRWVWLLIAAAAVLVVAVIRIVPTPTPIRPTPTTIITPRLVFIPTPVTPVPQKIVPRPGTTRVNLDALAPPGQARDMLIFQCSNCHPFVCAMRGQRTQGHWDLVRLTHVERGWVDMSDQDLDLLFGYLEANFNDKKPLPDIPPALADQGCTTPPLR